MKYLIIALLNAVYGTLLFTSLSQDTPGFFLIVIIAGIVTIVGVVGFIIWLRDFITSVKNGKEDSPAIKSWWQIAKSIDLLLILGLLFRALVMQPYVVEGSSMEPNFHDQEYLLVNMLTYRLRAPQRNETIVFRYPLDPKEDYIKRIVGLPGETISINDGKVFVNGQVLEQGFLPADEKTVISSPEKSEVNLKADEYFVLGDNRQHSSDSREWGILPKKDIIGRAWLVIYPWKYHGIVKNPKIVFMNLQASWQKEFKILITSSSLIWGKFS